LVGALQGGVKVFLLGSFHCNFTPEREEMTFWKIREAVMDFLRPQMWTSSQQQSLKGRKQKTAALLGIVHEHQHEEECIYYFCGQFVLKQIDSSNTVPSSLVLAADRMMYVSELLLN
jgi:hypothetical protein